MKPATPLPWSVLIEDGRNAVCGRVDPVTGKSIPRGMDAAYIVHAANSYPKLVEALRQDLKLFDLLAKESPARSDDNFAGYVVSADRIRFLLRELGEAA